MKIKSLKIIQYNKIPTVLIVLNGSWKQFSLAATSVTSALEVIYNEMRYTNLRFAYLLTNLCLNMC